MAGSSVAALAPGGDESAIHTSETFKPLRSYLDDCILCILQRTEVSVEAGEGITRGGFLGRRVPGGAFGGVSTGMSLGIEACMGDHGCGIKTHFITGQGEVENRMSRLQ